ncbi:hypothetical protein B0H66DRAFT_23425 [Apodospora peruviana]|uniref:Small secreted protein n=1 Tax=Apodospora peruviana TaxID=516989 RepID=A0AAE0IRV9_9PEZI|nr:hypothetical protein B0H66DRAFT_23425 [Apodospora peruviana]
MYLKTAFLFSMVVSAIALPTSSPKTVKRAAILDVQDYSDFQISDGVAGNALAEVQAKFPIDESDLANVDPEDLAIIKAARQTAENAETEAGGFNEAIEAAGGTKTAAGKVLQVGKIKNKVLKLKLFSLALQIDQAQGKDTADKLAETLTKLNNNIKQDEAAAGQPSQSVDFQGSSQPKKL